MYYPDELVEEVRMKSDIVDVMSRYKKREAVTLGSAPFIMKNHPPFPFRRESRCIIALAAGQEEMCLLSLWNMRIILFRRR